MAPQTDDGDAVAQAKSQNTQAVRIAKMHKIADATVLTIYEFDMTENIEIKTQS